MAIPSGESSIWCISGSGQRPRCFGHLPSLKKLAQSLTNLIRYFELNSGSVPDYGKQYRTGQRISTGFVESAANEIVSKRMVKEQQMRWNRYTVQSFPGRAHSSTQLHTRRRIPLLAQRLSANCRPAKTRSLSMTTPQLCTLSAFMINR
jgi:hypothetical protein